MLILLGDVAASTTMLTIACTQCEHHGRYRTDGLVERHGASFPVASLLDCGAHCPDLPQLFVP